MNAFVQKIFNFSNQPSSSGWVKNTHSIVRYIEIVQECLYKEAQIAEAVGDEVLIVGNDGARIIQIALELRRKIEREPNFPSIPSRFLMILSPLS